MADENAGAKTSLIELTADIVSAYVGNNPVPVASLPDLIASVNSSLNSIGHPAEPKTAAQAPAVNPRRSVFADYIICLEDGRKFKSLKRHLSVHYGLTPDEYRAKWALKADYPMVAPDYAAQRSALARSIGLGRKAAAAPVKGAGKKRSR